MTLLTADQNGFTAIELLITLIVASVFLFSGYQVYTQVVRDGADANRLAIISNKVNERLRKESLTTTSAAPSGCTPSNVLNNAPLGIEDVPGIGTVTYTKTVRCSANPTTLDVFMIKVEGSYNDAGVTRKVQHATYVN